MFFIKLEAIFSETSSSLATVSVFLDMRDLQLVFSLLLTESELQHKL